MPDTDTSSPSQNLQDQYATYQREVHQAADKEAGEAQEIQTEAQASAQQQIDLAKAFASSQQPFQQEQPHDQIKEVMSGAPWLFALTAIGGKASGMNGLAMLQGLNGMSDGLIKGDEEALDNSYKNYQASYDKWKAQSDQQYRVYKELSQAYAGANDGKLRAMEAAMKITGDARDKKLGVDDPERLWTMKAKLEEAHAKVMEARAKMAQIGGQAMDPDTLDMASTVVMADPKNMSQFASWGQAGSATRKQINDAMAQKLKSAGMTPEDLVELRARGASERKSLDQQVKMYRNITSFEQVAKFNGDRLVALSKKLDDPDIPIGSAVSRMAKRAGGSADAAEFASVMNTFQTEAARILNNPAMVGQLTEGARKDLQAVISGNMPTSQLDRVVKRLYAEFDVRKASIQQQIQESQTGAMPGAAGGGGEQPKSVNWDDMK
jgi:hypothetical protein